MLRSSWAVPTVALFCVIGGSAAAQSRLGNINLFKRIEADPNKDYRLTQQNGPWLVLCSTFVGEEGEQQARRLVYELRSEFKLNAYTHQMVWDFSDPVAGRGLDRYGRQKEMTHRNKGREETAVLVGDFPAVDDAEAQQVLEKIRHARPKCLDPEWLSQNNQKSAQALGAWRWAAANVLTTDAEKKSRGPMGKAFVVTNPLLPQEYFKPKGVDPLIERMNAPVEFSLLKCPGRYSVKIATFTGATVTMQQDIEAIEQGRKQLRSRLEQAAINAHLLTEALRAKGYEAYEFHDHGASMVTVGSFDTVGIPQPDGQLELHPQVHEYMKLFGAEVKNVNGRNEVGSPKNLAGIPFDVQPLPIEVPKQTISAAYDRSRLGLR